MFGANLCKSFGVRMIKNKKTAVQPIESNRSLKYKMRPTTFFVNKMTPDMKTFKSFVLSFVFIFVSMLSLAASGGEGDAITAWANQKDASVIKIENLNHGPIHQGAVVVAEVLSNHEGLADLTLTNREGKTIWGSSIVLDRNVNNLKIKFGQLPEGVYYLKIKSATAEATQPIVIY